MRPLRGLAPAPVCPRVGYFKSLPVPCLIETQPGSDVFPIVHSRIVVHLSFYMPASMQSNRDRVMRGKAHGPSLSIATVHLYTPRTTDCHEVRSAPEMVKGIQSYISIKMLDLTS